MILSFRTDMPGQIVQTQIRVYTVCHSVCIVWTHYSMIEPHSSNFRVSTTKFLGVWIFRKFTVLLISLRSSSIRLLRIETLKITSNDFKHIYCIAFTVTKFSKYSTIQAQLFPNSRAPGPKFKKIGKSLISREWLTENGDRNQTAPSGTIWTGSTLFALACKAVEMKICFT